MKTFRSSTPTKKTPKPEKQQTFHLRNMKPKNRAFLHLLGYPIFLTIKRVLDGRNPTSSLSKNQLARTASEKKKDIQTRAQKTFRYSHSQKKSR